MVVVDSDRYLLGDLNRRRADKSARKEGVEMQKVEDGEASDLKATSFSTATITSAAAAVPTTATSDSTTRYWMGDLYKYSYPRAYAASGLYNLAWAQAVQKKPQNEVQVESKRENDSTGPQGDVGNEDDSKVGGDTNNCSVASFEPVNATVKDDCVVAVSEDDEKEEGELEEGEIDMDFEPVNPDENCSLGGGFRETGMDEEEELEDRVLSIRKMLDNVNAKEAEKSFEVACARLRSSIESVQELILHCWFPSKDALIQQSFEALKSVHLVFSSMSPLQKEQNKGAVSRLITYVRDLHPALFSPEQMKEIEAAVVMISSLDISQRKKISEELPAANMPYLIDSNSLVANSTNESDIIKKLEESSSFSSFAKNDSAKKSVALDLLNERGPNRIYDVRASRSSNIQRKIGIIPLLDLHQIHEEDGLPSPTQKTSIPLVDHYESDALRAVSSYQQKFGRSSFNELPSPTPSEEGDGGGAEDASEEVSSFQHPNMNSTKPSISLPTMFSSFLSGSSSIPQGLNNRNMPGVSGPAPSLTSQGSAKSRDPRLRYMNLDLTAAVEGPAMKKQKNDRQHDNPGIDQKDPQIVSGSRGPEMNSIIQRSYSTAVPTDPRKQLMEKAKLAASSSDRLGIDKKDLQTMVGSRGPEMNSITERSYSTTVPTDPRKQHMQKTNFAASSTDSLGIDKTDLQTMAGNRGAEMNSINERSYSTAVPTDPRKQYMEKANFAASSSATRIVCSGSGLPPANTNSSISLLKDIVMNPELWMNILKEQQKLVDPLKGASDHPNLSSFLKAVPISSVATGMVDKIPGSAPVVPPPKMTSSQDESATVLRMKPRDPRRMLHAHNTEVISVPGSEPPKTDQLQMAAFPGSKDTSNKPTLINGICASTMRSESSEEGPSVSVQSYCPWNDVDDLFDGYDDHEKAAIQKERTRRIDEQRKLFSARKLCLVLDLDHTLLNSAKFSEVDPIHDDMLRKKEERDRDKQYRHLFRFPHMGMWTKLRPGIWNFLEKASSLFELHLYTMGNKRYATEMAKVLDPKGTLFAGRVISRGDDSDLLDVGDRAPKTKDLEGVLGMESGILIIDDSVRVWPQNHLNLILVERYTFFPCSRRQFGLPGPSLLEIDHDERPDEGTLASCLAVIEKVHQNFFAEERLEDADVRSILASEQRKILAGCRILFSGIFPVGEANPHLHPLWKSAEQFGAVCTNQIDEMVTHVVATSARTEKVNWAHSRGRYVVHPGWIEASALLYRRANELNFAVKP